MFDILAYLYETYYRPDACPDAAVLTRKLSALGFPEEEISEALDWLAGLSVGARATLDWPGKGGSVRIYTEAECTRLGIEALGMVTFFTQIGLLDPGQRELVLERAQALGEAPLSGESLKMIVLMVLWSQGRECDALLLDTLVHGYAPALQSMH